MSNITTFHFCLKYLYEGCVQILKVTSVCFGQKVVYVDVFWFFFLPDSGGMLDRPCTLTGSPENIE